MKTVSLIFQKHPMSKNIAGFSKRTKEEKIDWLISNHFNGSADPKKIELREAR